MGSIPVGTTILIINHLKGENHHFFVEKLQPCSKHCSGFDFFLENYLKT